MGLDMYLTAEVYVGGQWDHRKVSGSVTIPKKDGANVFKATEMASIEINLGYWRKANHIHSWFVRHVQGGVDECQKASVSREQLQQLLDVCTQVRDDHDRAPELMPTQSGFFFGPTDYDEYYFTDLDDTIAIITNALQDGRLQIADIYYRSSW